MLKTRLRYAITILGIMIIPINLCRAKSLISFGYWQGNDPALYQPNWGAVSNVAYSAWQINSDGTLVPPQGQYWSNFNVSKDQAHAHNIPYQISFLSADQDAMDNILAYHREDFANNLLEAVISTGSDGVDLDLEFPRPTNDITGESNIVLFEDLIRRISTKLKNTNPDYRLSMAISSAVEQVYRNSNLDQYIDTIFLMGYEYQYWLEGKAGPGSPYDDPTRYDVKETIDTMLNYYNPHKIILGVPFYAYDVITSSDQVDANVVGDNQVISMSTAMAEAAAYGRRWDANSHTPWYTYNDGTNWHQVWYEDEESIGIKYNYVKTSNLGGIGFWAFGFEGDYKDIWNIFLDREITYQTLHINNGSGSGSYRQGENVVITASVPDAGKVFDKWIGDTSYISDVYASSIHLTMPAISVSLTATYKNPSSSWYNSAYTYRRAIVLNHSQVANSDQSNFPVLVSTTDSAFKSIAQGGKVQNPSGFDIIFTDANGVKLDYEIEKYDASSGKVIAWIKIPIISHSTDTIIYIYYGNSQINSSQENKNAVWSNGYKLVQHMDQNTATAAPQLIDSTGNEGNGTFGGAMGSVNQNAKIGNAVSFNGTSDYFSMNLDLSGTNKTTLSFWFNPTVVNSDDARVILETSSDYNDRTDGFVVTYDENSKSITAVLKSDAGYSTRISTTQLTANTWYYVTIIYDKSLPNEETQMYINGTPEGSYYGSGNDTATIFLKGPVYVMSRAGSSNFGYGSLDEIRISSIVRSADWIATEYNNQNTPSAFFTLSAEESYNAPVASYSLIITNGSGSGSYASGQTVTISANPAAPGKMFDGWTGDTAYLSNNTSSTTILTMPDKSISLTALYKDESSSSFNPSGSSSSFNTNTNARYSIKDNPTYPAGTLLKTASSFKVYVVKDNKKKWILTPEIFMQLGYSWSEIKILTETELSAIPDYEDNLIRAIGDYKVYLVVNGVKRHIPSPGVFLSYGFAWGDVKDVDKSTVDKYKDTYLIKASGTEGIYYINSKNIRKLIPTTQVFNSYDYKPEDIQIISSYEMQSYPQSSLIKLGTSNDIYLVEGDIKRRIPNMEVFNRHKFSWGRIMDVNETEFNFYTNGKEVK